MRDDGIATEEQWRPVVEFEGLYEVSDLGRVRSVPRLMKDGRRHHSSGTIMKPVLVRGYPAVNLTRRDSRRLLGKVHRFVLEAFVGPRPDGMECCHGDGDRTNNRLANLRWDTTGGNASDKVRLGSVRGERNSRAVLREDDVRAIRHMVSVGATQQEAARRFGVTKDCVWSIVHRQTWKHVD